MITVEKVVKKNATGSAVQTKENEELKSNSVKEIKKSPWPWFGLAALILVGAWYFLIHKGSGTNERIPG
jgi:hypothetical protein